MIEPQLAEFVGLACYHARNLLGREGVPQGVLEKMTALVAHHVPIEGVEKTFARRGRRIRYRARGLAREVTYTLSNLRSRYFERERQAHVTVFRSTPHFLAQLPSLSSKPYIPVYESWIQQLLTI